VANKGDIMTETKISAPSNFSTFFVVQLVGGLNVERYLWLERLGQGILLLDLEG
jgi:hypothetical protein